MAGWNLKKGKRMRIIINKDFTNLGMLVNSAFANNLCCFCVLSA